MISNHKPTKRRNGLRWMQARLRRLDYECSRGTATDRQKDRAHQLGCAIQVHPDFLRLKERGLT